MDESPNILKLQKGMLCPNKTIPAFPIYPKIEVKQETVIIKSESSDEKGQVDFRQFSRWTHTNKTRISSWSPRTPPEGIISYNSGTIHPTTPTFQTLHCARPGCCIEMFKEKRTRSKHFCSINCVMLTYPNYTGKDADIWRLTRENEALRKLLSVNRVEIPASIVSPGTWDTLDALTSSVGDQSRLTNKD